MDYESIKRRYELALDIAKQASAFLLENERLGKQITTKAENDYVTLADKECEKLIVDRICKEFPDDAIFGE